MGSAQRGGPSTTAGRRGTCPPGCPAGWHRRSRRASGGGLGGVLYRAQSPDPLQSRGPRPGRQDARGSGSVGDRPDDREVRRRSLRGTPQGRPADVVNKAIGRGRRSADGPGAVVAAPSCRPAAASAAPATCSWDGSARPAAMAQPGDSTRGAPTSRGCRGAASTRIVPARRARPDRCRGAGHGGRVRRGRQHHCAAEAARRQRSAGASSRDADLDRDQGQVGGCRRAGVRCHRRPPSRRRPRCGTPRPCRRMCRRSRRGQGPSRGVRPAPAAPRVAPRPRPGREPPPRAGPPCWRRHFGCPRDLRVGRRSSAGSGPRGRPAWPSPSRTTKRSRSRATSCPAASRSSSSGQASPA